MNRERERWGRGDAVNGWMGEGRDNKGTEGWARGGGGGGRQRVVFLINVESCEEKRRLIRHFSPEHLGKA